MRTRPADVTVPANQVAQILDGVEHVVVGHVRPYGVGRADRGDGPSAPAFDLPLGGAEARTYSGAGPLTTCARSSGRIQRANAARTSSTVISR